MGGGFLAQLKTGEVFPDELFGWSSKTILAGLLALMILKLKTARSTAKGDE